MLRRLIVGVLFAVAAHAQTGVWPQQMGANQLKGEQTVQVTADRELWDEYGLVSATEGDYGAFKATAYRFKAPTEGFAAGKWIASTNPNTTLAGNYVVTCQGRCPAGSTFEQVQFPGRRHEQEPLVWAYMPSKGRIAGSGRYAVGSFGLRQFAPQIPETAAAFQYSTEVAVAKYRTPKGDEELILLAFPAPQIARQQEAELAAKLSGAAVRRSGPLVGVVPNPHDAAAADRLLALVNYQAQVNWDEKPKPKVTAQGVANMILSIFKLAGLLIAFCLVAGLGFAGIKLARKRLGYQSADDAMIVLHLLDR
jgi:hypothetical protein